MTRTKRLRRSESFLGIHFDFHASDDCHEIGRRTTPDMIEHIIKMVEPDYVQCDCKGHRGLSSYPTKVGNPAPGFVGDGLKIWREVTAKYGVALYVHYSGVWDTEAVTRNPQWARVDEAGQPDQRLTSTFGPYVDRLLIPQIKELIDSYDIDGVWIDGECWAAARDYRGDVLARFHHETGIQDVPRSPGDPFYREFTEYHREGFRNYLRHYVEALHTYRSDFQIASNWAFSSHMPEPVTVDVDYLSGDYSLQNSVNSARFEARCIASQDKPWDLMAWAFSGPQQGPDRSTKSVVQLQQEASIVLAMGGGFQAYFNQKRDGSISRWQMQLMQQVGQYCRVRQPYCHKAVMVPQVGLLYSTAAYYRKSNRLFSPWNDEVVPLRGILQALLDSQESVQIVMEHHLQHGRMAEYPLIVIPEWGYLDGPFREELLRYVADGGKLLVIGPTTASLFQSEIGFQPSEPVLPDTVRWIRHGNWLAAVKSPFQPVILAEGAEAFAQCYKENDIVEEPEVFASVTSWGKGEIGAVYSNIGEAYFRGATSVVRDVLRGLVRRLFPDPIVEVKGSHFVDVVVATLPEKMVVHLVNTAGPHANPDVYVYDEIPPVGPLEVSIRGVAGPKSVVVEPEHRVIPYENMPDGIRIRLPELQIHTAILIEN